MSVLTQKDYLRAEAKQKRKALFRGNADRAICSRLLQLAPFCESDLALCYVSVGSEPDTRAFLSCCFANGKRTALPRCEGGEMRFHEVRSLDKLKNSVFGIPEPDPNDPAAQCSEKTLCIVPGLLFDRTGFRLGYGGGYYDRFLAAFPGKTVGLCYEALLCDTLPREAFDFPVQTIITEKRTITIR